MPHNRLATWVTAFRKMLPMIVVVLMLLAATEVLACPTCKDGIAENDPAGQAQAAGYFYSILFMMSMPFVLIGTLGGAAYVSIRRAREREVAGTIAELHG